MRSLLESPGVEYLDPYPVTLSIEYPDRPLDRLSTALRIFYAIPILIVAAAVGGGTVQLGTASRTYAFAAGGGLLFFAPLLMIVFREKYPRWWFDWNLNLARFTTRVTAYVALMDDHYPATDEDQSVRLTLPYPNPKTDLNRWLPIVKWLLAIPHYIVLFFLDIGAVLAAIGAWFAILFTGRYPRGLFAYIEGVFRWNARVAGYAIVLVTDRYPPFRLAP
jgi:Domain of unknown function (DUF4389)